jgi:predicted DNA-binding protein (MmcQ/YjbR family)
LSQPLEACRSFALSLPEAWEDQPWDESLVAKVGKKIFVFLGSPEEPGISVKLPDSAGHALSLVAGTPTGYGLGRHHWVSLDLAAGDCPDTEVLLDWVEESYRTVAPKRLVTQLDTP